MSPDPAAQPTSLEYEQQMTKKVLRKLDLHVLPPLAVVSRPCSCLSSLDIITSYGWPTLLTAATLATQGQSIADVGEPH